MAGHLTRKELKSDQVAVTVENTFDYVQAHQKPIIRGAVIAVVLAILIGGFVFYRSEQRTTRQARLGEAIAVAQAPIGAAAGPDSLAFPTSDAKAAEENKVFSKLISDYPGTEEAYISEYYLGGVAISQAKMDEARKRYQDVIDHGGKNIASLARLALAQIDFDENKNSEAETLLRELIDHPTDMVSSDQAKIALANGIKTKNPAEARKLLEPLVKESGEVAGTASRVLNDIPK